MKKNERIAVLVESLAAGGGTRAVAAGEAGAGQSDNQTIGQSELDARYLGYFTCFNDARYYEAHDVLENLWLQGVGAEYAFFKGLIQIAGAYVHLQKQFLRPDHPKDGKRMRPAVRLFELGARNVEPYGPRHLQLNVAALCARCRQTAEEIAASEFTRNPWSPERAPKLHLES